MPSLVPLQSVVVSREHPKKVKDKEGNITHVRHSPKVGKPFDFTDAEVQDLKDAGARFRTPQNETSEHTTLIDAAEADRIAREAAEEARKAGGAPGDAAGTARAGANGKAKPPVKETGTGDQEAAETADDEEEL